MATNAAKYKEVFGLDVWRIFSTHCIAADCRKCPVNCCKKLEKRNSVIKKPNIAGAHIQEWWNKEYISRPCKSLVTTNKEKFIQVFGFEPYGICPTYYCKDCPAKNSNDDKTKCNPKEWWNSQYKEPYKQEVI